MEEIVDSVKRVTDIMGEITAASQEQTSGIEQVNQADHADGPGDAAERRAGRGSLGGRAIAAGAGRQPRKSSACSSSTAPSGSVFKPVTRVGATAKAAPKTPPKPGKPAAKAPGAPLQDARAKKPAASAPRLAMAGGADAGASDWTEF